MDSTQGLVGTILLAQGVKFQIIWYTLGIVGALLAGAVIIALFERWRKKSGIEGMSAGDQLTHFRKLYDQGAISKEEFEQIRSQLAGDLRKELNVPSQTEATPMPQSPDIMTLPRPPEEEPRPGM